MRTTGRLGTPAASSRTSATKPSGKTRVAMPPPAGCPADRPPARHSSSTWLAQRRWRRALPRSAIPDLRRGARFAGSPPPGRLPSLPGRSRPAARAGSRPRPSNRAPTPSRCGRAGRPLADRGRFPSWAAACRSRGAGGQPGTVAVREGPRRQGEIHRAQEDTRDRQAARRELLDTLLGLRVHG